MQPILATAFIGLLTNAALVDEGIEYKQLLLFLLSFIGSDN